MYVLNKDEGGRHKPFFTNYRPQFYFRTTDVTGTIALPEGTEMVMPGDNTDMTVELAKPIAMTEGLRFAIREGWTYRGLRSGHQDPRVDEHPWNQREDAVPMAAEGPRQKISIRLKAYDHEILDQSTEKIVETVLRTQAKVLGPGAAADGEAPYTVIRSPHKYKDSRSTSRCGCTSASSISSSTPRRPSTRSSGSTCRPGWTSRSRSRPSRSWSGAARPAPSGRRQSAPDLRDLVVSPWRMGYSDQSARSGSTR